MWESTEQRAERSIKMAETIEAFPVFPSLLLLPRFLQIYSESAGGESDRPFVSTVGHINLAREARGVGLLHCKHALGAAKE